MPDVVSSILKKEKPLTLDDLRDGNTAKYLLLKGDGGGSLAYLITQKHGTTFPWCPKPRQRPG